MTTATKFTGQYGFTIWTILVVLAAAGFILTIAFKLAPAYISNYDVKSVIEALVSEPGLGKMSNGELRSLLERRFDINRIEAIKAQCRAKDEGKIPCVNIERNRDTVIIDAGYEVRIPVMANVDAVVMFYDNKIEVPIQGG